MNIQYHAPFSINEYTKGLIEEKIAKLTKLNLRFSEAHVYFKLKEGKNVPDNKELEIKIQVPRQTLFANSLAETYEKAIPDVFEKLRRQVIKYKDALEAKR